MTKLGASQARDAFSDTLNRVAYRGERIVLRRHGRELAAIVPISDLRFIQRAEDDIDRRAALQALSEMKRKRQKPGPYDEIRKRLGFE